VKQKIREIAVFAVLGVILFVADIAFEALPNIHLVGVLIVAITAVYRVKALFPIYVYVFLNGLYGGFSTWWIPYIYVWAVLWGFTMLLPREMPKVVRPIAYSLVCGFTAFCSELFMPLFRQFSLALILTAQFPGLLRGCPSI